MKRVTKLDILYITISIVILLISFFLTGFYKTNWIQHLSEYPNFIVIDIYSLVLVPVAVILFILGKYRITLALIYTLIFSLFKFFRISPWEFHYKTGITVLFIIIYVIFIAGIYILSNQKYSGFSKFAQNKYFKIGYYCMFLIAFFILTGAESKVSQIIYGFLLLVGLLSIIHNLGKWIIEYIILSLISLLLSTFYLGCCFHHYSDLVFIDFSISNIFGNCLKNYLWLISSFILLYITVKKINTPPNIV